MKDQILAAIIFVLFLIGSLVGIALLVTILSAPLLAAIWLIGEIIKSAL